MKYISNTGRYGVAFEVTFNGKPMKVEFDRKRMYLDTGNIATSGITSVEDELYKVLLTNKRFKKMIDKGELKLVDEKALKGTSQELEVLKAENETLKAQLENAEKKEDKETKKELEAKDEEIKSLKAQLEALTKDKEAEAKNKEAEAKNKEAEAKNKEAEAKNKEAETNTDTDGF